MEANAGLFEVVDPLAGYGLTGYGLKYGQGSL